MTESPRTILIQLIEAYADSKASKNEYLMGHMAEKLSLYLKEHDIIAPIELPAELSESIKPIIKKSTRKKLETTSET